MTIITKKFAAANVRGRSRRRGSAIMETGPALFILLIMVFFPLMDIIGLGADYAFAHILHQSEVRQLAVEVPQPASGGTAVGSKEYVAQGADTNTITAMPGFAKFCGITLQDIGTSSIRHQITYLDINNGAVTGSSQAAVGSIANVSVTTIVSFKPFLTIPFLPKVPGLSSAMEFSVTTVATQEEKGLNG